MQDLHGFWVFNTHVPSDLSLANLAASSGIFVGRTDLFGKKMKLVNSVRVEQQIYKHKFILFSHFQNVGLLINTECFREEFYTCSITLTTNSCSYSSVFCFPHLAYVMNIFSCNDHIWINF